MSTAPVWHSFPDAAQTAQALADHVAQSLAHGIAQRGRAALAVPGGRTPGPFLRALFAHSLPWDKIILTLTDERWVDTDSADSNHALVESYRQGSAAMAACFLPLKTAFPTPQDGCAALAQRLAALPARFDAVVLGMGEDGHVASLFPGQPDEDGGAPCLPGLAPTLPHHRVSLSQSRLLACDGLFLLISGQAKQDLLASAGSLPVHRLMQAADSPIWIYHSGP